MKRHASAVWMGTLREGNGELSTESGALTSIPYSFKTRFEGQQGTNPEELIAVAHAACFSMALSGELQKARLKPENIRTDATLSFEQIDGQWTISEVRLDVSAQVPGATQEQVNEAIERAKEGCPVSRVLKARILATSARQEAA